MSSPFRLYYFMQLGCPACAAAEPAVRQFKAGHAECLLLNVNARTGRKVAGFRAKVTPSYLMVVGKDRRGLEHEGPLDVDGLEEMLAEARGELEDDLEPDDEDDPPENFDGAGDDEE